MRPIRPLLFAVLLLLSVRAPAGDGTEATESGNGGVVDDPHLQERVEKACIDLAARIDGLLGARFQAPVPVRVVTRKFIREFAREEERKQTPEGEAAAVQRLAVRLRQVPAGLDISEKTLDLLEQQVAGLYDPDANTFYVVQHMGEPPSFLFMTTAAHELVHAYRDVDGDYWERTLATVPEDADWAIAITCLVEGDATLLGTPIGVAVINHQEAKPLVDASAAQAQKMAAALRQAVGSGELRDFPFALREMLLGRYAIGLVFAAAIYEQGGVDALAAAYRCPPRSTEQVLHPEKYLADRPDEPTVFSGGDPTAALGEGWEESLSSTSGEFDVRIQFTEVLGRKRSEEAAAGWDGMRLHFCEKEGASGFVGIISTWDTEDDAHEFAQAWGDWASRRDGETRSRAQKDGRDYVDTADGLVVVEVRGRDVVVADGVPADRVDPVLAALGSAERRERGADENLAEKAAGAGGD